MTITEKVIDRAGSLSGFVFVIVYFISITLTNPFEGSIDLDPDEYSSIFTNVLTANRDTVNTGVYIALISLFFFFAFLAYLRKQLRLIEQPNGWLASMAFGGGLVAAGMFLLEQHALLSTTLASDYREDWQVAKTLSIDVWSADEMLGPALAALVIATGLVSIQGPGLWKGFGWASIIISLVILLYTPGLGLILFLVWIILANFLILFPIAVEELPTNSLGRQQAQLQAQFAEPRKPTGIVRES